MWFKNTYLNDKLVIHFLNGIYCCVLYLVICPDQILIAVILTKLDSYFYIVVAWIQLDYEKFLFKWLNNKFFIGIIWPIYVKCCPSVLITFAKKWHGIFQWCWQSLTLALNPRWLSLLDNFEQIICLCIIIKYWSMNWTCSLPNEYTRSLRLHLVLSI